MQKQSKKKNIDNLDLGLDDEDLGSDPLDMSDISDDSLLSLEFQEIKEFDIGEDADRGGEELGTKPSNLLDYAKGLLKRVQDKPGPDTEQAKAQKSVGKKKKASEDENAINKFNTKFYVIELMIEELENFGLDIKVI
ncbi:MAG: hypothetical protein KAJ51_11570, partial [Thermoplasmata archaeon]|nr:hypothetical protein [Thermoplasmata archaeon]